LRDLGELEVLIEHIQAQDPGAELGIAQGLQFLQLKAISGQGQFVSARLVFDRLGRDVVAGRAAFQGAFGPAAVVVVEVVVLVVDAFLGCVGFAAQMAGNLINAFKEKRMDRTRSKV